MATENQRYTVSVDEGLFQEIENYRFQNRFQTRSKATVELIRYALKHLKKNSNEESQKNKPILSEQEENLLFLYRQLDQRRQEEVMDFANYKMAQSKNTPPDRFANKTEIIVTVTILCFSVLSICTPTVKER